MVPSNDHTDSLGEIPHLQLNWNAKKEVFYMWENDRYNFLAPNFAPVPGGVLLNVGGWDRPHLIPNSRSLSWEFGIRGRNNHMNSELEN